MSSIDDLLKYEDDEPGAHRQTGGFSYRWLLRPVLFSAIGAVGIGLVVRVAGVAVPVTLIFMVLLVVQLLRLALTWIAARPVPTALLRRPEPPTGLELGQDGLALATGRWETRLSWARLQGDPAHFSRTVQPRLVQLIDERLRLRHGVVRANDPARARALLGDPLWTFVSTPVNTAMTPRDLVALIKQMEEL